MPGDRAALAHSAGKPLLMEEYGAQKQYITPRDTLIHRYLFISRVLMQVRGSCACICKPWMHLLYLPPWVACSDDWHTLQ
jgi:hypothetical protein